jgi:hypothetical protein
MTQGVDRVKGFSSGVLTNGGAIQREQDREAKKERERLEKEAGEAEEKRLAEVEERRKRLREQRALEISEESKARHASEEERYRKAAEKAAHDEEERLKNVAAREATRLAKQQDLDRRLADKKQKEAAALIAKQQEQERQKQKQVKSVTLLDDLSKIVDIPKAVTPKREALIKEPEEVEKLEESLLQIVKGEVHVPTSTSAIDENMATKAELLAAYDMNALMPAPTALTVEGIAQPEVRIESGKELIGRILEGNEQAPEHEEQTSQSARSENRFQKIINVNRELAKENAILKEKVEKLLDEVHAYKIEDELVEKIANSTEQVKNQIAKTVPKVTLEDRLQANTFSVVNEAKQEMLRYLSTRQDEVDHFHKSGLFLKYIQDPFYMNMFVQNNPVSQWWPIIDSIYNAIEMPSTDWSKVKYTPYQDKSVQQQPIRARTATLGAPVASSELPMDRIAQHLGNMGI